jgi:hypothetical protein
VQSPDFANRAEEHAKITSMPRIKKRSATLQRVPRGQSHPYERHENTPLWKAIDKAVTDLVVNQDLVENEYHEYIVGHICKVIDRRRNRIVALLARRSRP